MRELFIGKNFQAKTLAIIDKANEIIQEYQKLGFILTLRQLYYQFVARGILPNKMQSYDNLGAIISDARLAGLIDWDAIEDRTRFLRGHRTYNDPAQAIKDIAKGYRIDMWEGQLRRVEVWIEKDALVGVIEKVCNEYDVNFFACKGYASQSELYSAGKRIAYRRHNYEQDTLVLHLGDHDPSGMDMTRDNEDRLSLFAGDYVEVRRVALNMAQINLYNPPPNPAKLTDSRAPAYIAEFGRESWELDALEPKMFDDLLSEQIEREIDFELWLKREKEFKEHKELLTKSVKFAGMDEDFKKWRQVHEQGFGSESHALNILEKLGY